MLESPFPQHQVANPREGLLLGGKEREESEGLFLGIQEIPLFSPSPSGMDIQESAKNLSVRGLWTPSSAEIAVMTQAY